MPDYILRVGLLIFKSSLWGNALEARWNLVLATVKVFSQSALLHELNFLSLINGSDIFLTKKSIKVLIFNTTILRQ